MAQRTHGFTLIELLVVITIIVILLALLSPALDRAIYEAEMTVCAARQRAAASGFVAYASNYKRRFPIRLYNDKGDGWTVSALSPGRGAAQAYNVYTSGSAAAPDLRPLIRPYMDINRTLNDPFVEPVDLDQAHPDVHTFGSYHMFAGWKYYDPIYAGAGMLKLGDKLGWNGRRYSAMVADNDEFNLADAYSMSSHSDKNGVLRNRVFQDQESETGEANSAPFTGTGLTLSWWDNYPNLGVPRGLVDRNVAYHDLSVERFNDVQYPVNRGGNIETDPRMGSVAWTRVADGFNGTWPIAGVQIPNK